MSVLRKFIASGRRHASETVLAAMAGAVFVTLAAPVPSANAASGDAADQLMKILLADPACEEDWAKPLVDKAREGIENAVRRAEALIGAPLPAGDLACLDNLMDVNLDFAINLPSLGDIFSKAVSNAEQSLCDFAMEKWNKLTEPLNANFDLSLPGFQDGWGNFNFGSTSSGSSGGTAQNGGQNNGQTGGQNGANQGSGNQEGGGQQAGPELTDPSEANCPAGTFPAMDPTTMTWKCTDDPSGLVTPDMLDAWKTMMGVDL